MAKNKENTDFYNIFKIPSIWNEIMIKKESLLKTNKRVLKCNVISVTIYAYNLIIDMEKIRTIEIWLLTPVLTMTQIILEMRKL